MITNNLNKEINLFRAASESQIHPPTTIRTITIGAMYIHSIVRMMHLIYVVMLFTTNPVCFVYPWWTFVVICIKPFLNSGNTFPSTKHSSDICNRTTLNNFIPWIIVLSLSCLFTNSSKEMIYHILLSIHNTVKTFHWNSNWTFAFVSSTWNPTTW